MIVLCILVFIYFIFNIMSIVNVFMLSIEKKIDSCHFQPPSIILLKSENQKVAIIAYSVIIEDCYIKKGPGTQPYPSIAFRIFPQNVALNYIYQLTKFNGLLSYGSKHSFNNLTSLINQSHHDVTDLKVQEMVTSMKNSEAVAGGVL